jgi:glycopeptide antibiotics resistance protein
LLVYLVLFSAELGRIVVKRDYNLVPFQTISRYITYRNRFGEVNYITNIYGNIIAFVPLGIFIYLFQKKHRILSGFIIPFMISCIIEISQFILSVGSFDIDDIILNTLGGSVAYAILYILHKMGVIKK